jgi:hypothetical protein
MKLPIKTIAAAALAITGVIAATDASSAMQIAPAMTGASSMAQDVRWGCGPGWHPTPWGRCVPDRRAQYYSYGQPRYYGNVQRFYGHGGPRPDWRRPPGDRWDHY